MNAIQGGIDSGEIQIIQDPVEIQKLGFRLIQTATEEILVIHSTTNAFHLQEHEGGTQLLREAAKERDVKVRILTPTDELIEETAQKLMTMQEEEQLHEKIGLRYIQPHSQTKLTILIIDRKSSLAIELKDDTKQTSNEAIGLATYSNSQSTVLSYVSIFESLWKQTKLYEQLKVHDKLQEDFISIAAHELRTPLQLIIAGVDLLKIRHGKQERYLDIIISNAKILRRLTEDILNITRIESKSLGLKKEIFNLTQTIFDSIVDSENQIAKENKYKNLKLELVHSRQKDILIEADKGRISQVISNLLSNAIKFSNEGIISVTAEKKDNEVLVSIKDNGADIDAEIVPRLFTKFATKSETGGTGLDLFISKSIIEAHGGRILAENNNRIIAGQKGATFYLTLPMTNNQNNHQNEREGDNQ
jgi:two-component system, OmpR family, sensor histidine kinase VicK